MKTIWMLTLEEYEDFYFREGMDMLKGMILNYVDNAFKTRDIQQIGLERVEIASDVFEKYKCSGEHRIVDFSSVMRAVKELVYDREIFERQIPCMGYKTIFLGDSKKC